MEQFSSTRHDHRVKGPYLVGEDTPPDLVVTGGRVTPHPGLPGYWCKWAPTEDGSAIQWNEEEKFYEADMWMAYLIDTFLKPGATVARQLADPVAEWIYPADFAQFTFDHVVNGVIEAEGEEPEDRWRIEVRDNIVHIVQQTVQPSYDEISPAELGDWGDGEWERFVALTRHNITFLVHGGQRQEVDPAC
ncbi:hypothetical protein Rhe02_70910 [Rhizocola hellebori]|uniref:Uncharacterized protein n=1 Tax=Rhizocola hellebori TaxID=1392758 RepID=A0A8J3VJ39_9ACTN|nr:hypothetical protein Rhe02_70910 [Rhizocola hellebori]